MELSDATASPSSLSPSSSSSPRSLPQPQPPPPQPLAPVVSPCAACKILRRRCAERCVLAPYFPPSEPYKFTIAHRVFGASNIIKFLQELPDSQREDAVSSMVYEANARIRDPVYGCAGAICQLQKQVSQLQGQLAKAHAELATVQLHQANLVASLLCMEVAQTQTQSQTQQPPPPPTLTTSYEEHHHQPPPDSFISTSSFFDDNNPGSLWDPLWT